MLSGNLEFVDTAVRAAERRGFAAIGVFTSSLRDCDASGVPLALRLLPAFPDVIINTVSFPVFTLSSPDLAVREERGTPFEVIGVPLIQAICCGTPRAVWSASERGLSPSEAAMNVALPECDGRVISVPISFKENHRYLPDAERTQRIADFAHRFAVLRSKPNAEKRVAIILSNAGGKAQRIGGAVGLDTPASLLQWLIEMRAAGYEVGALPDSSDTLMSATVGRRLLRREASAQSSDGLANAPHPVCTMVRRAIRGVSKLAGRHVGHTACARTDGCTAVLARQQAVGPPLPLAGPA